MKKELARISSIVLILAFAATLAVSIYVRDYLPHGPSVPTGDYVCMNDGRGPCGEEHIEDMSQLAIPDWAKFFRRYGFFIAVLLPFAAWLFLSIANEAKD